MASPDGNDLCSTIVDASVWNNGGIDEEEITFDTPTVLTSGGVYTIVVRIASGRGKWQNNWSNPYANGSQYTSSDSGSTWNETPANDLWFQTKASGIVKDSNTAAQTNLLSVGGNLWLAQSFTASSTYTITSIALRVGRSVPTPTNATISIQGTLSAPTKAKTPAPVNTATNVTLDQATLTWEDGGGADTYNVYYGDTSGSLSLVSSAQAGTSLTVTGITLGSPYDYVVTRYWRIDSTNAAGTTTGDEWSFTTINFDQLRVTYELISGGSGNGPYDIPTPGVEGTDFRYTGENNMITVRKLVAAANDKIWIEDT